ncbi:adenylate/guanylate cyclase domain-containing protein [Bradyrhizobium sp. 13971]
MEFASVVGAMRCAVAIQRGMITRNTDVRIEKRIEFRIGINAGDIIIEGGDIFGDGVNVAARLEALCEPGDICVSQRVREDTQDKLDVEFEDSGEHQLKNIARPVRVYRVSFGNAPARPALALPDKPSVAVLAFENMSSRPGAGVLCGWNFGRHHHRVVPLLGLVRDRTQFEFSIQGQSG